MKKSYSQLKLTKFRYFTLKQRRGSTFTPFFKKKFTRVKSFRVNRNTIRLKLRLLKKLIIYYNLRSVKKAIILHRTTKLMPAIYKWRSILNFYESRLDNVICKLGLANSIKQASDFIKTKSIFVNSIAQKYHNRGVKIGDIISYINPKSKIRNSTSVILLLFLKLYLEIAEEKVPSNFPVTVRRDIYPSYFLFSRYTLTGVWFNPIKLNDFKFRLRFRLFIYLSYIYGIH